MAISTGNYAKAKSLPAGKYAIKDIPKGEFIRANETTSKTYQRGDYVPSLRKYELIDTDDVNHCRYVKGEKEWLVGFTY